MLRTFRLLTIQQIQRRLPFVPAYFSQRSFAASTSTAGAAKKEDDDDHELNQPVQYLGSQAAKWRAQKTRSGGSDEAPWYQAYVISASVGVFLLYFCVLREESDIDLKLEGSLFEHISGLEETQLIVTYKYNLENGKSNIEVVQRLKELGIDPNELK